MPTRRWPATTAACCTARRWRRHGQGVRAVGAAGALPGRRRSSARAAHLARLGLPTRLAEVSNRPFPPDALLAAMGRDKKVENARLQVRPGAPDRRGLHQRRRAEPRRCAPCWPRMADRPRAVAAVAADVPLARSPSSCCSPPTRSSSRPSSRWSRCARSGSRRWRRPAAGRPRLAGSILKHLEAYLAACQLGITMASLGLGWVGEPAVAALLEPLFRLARPERGRAAHRGVPRRLPDLLLAAHRHRRAGAQDASRSASPSRSRSGWRRRCTPSSCCAGRSTGRLTPPRAPACGCWAWPRPATTRSSPAPSCAS